MHTFSKANHGTYKEALKRDMKTLLQTVMPHFRVLLNKFALSAQLMQLDSILPTSFRVARHCIKKAVSAVIQRCDWNICLHAQPGFKLS